MTDAVADSPQEPGKPGGKSLILALVLALAGAGGGFYAVGAGLIPLGKYAPSVDGMEAARDSTTGEVQAEKKVPGEAGKAMEGIAFVEVDPITISLNASQSVKHLRFRAQLEVNADYEREVSAMLPRVTDVLNSYLRALELADLTGPLALVRLRAQMLRRVQVITGKGRVRDLLIMEFVLN
jgi:flagellar protein FliL